MGTLGFTWVFALFDWVGMHPFLEPQKAPKKVKKQLVIGLTRASDKNLYLICSFLGGDFS